MMSWSNASTTHVNHFNQIFMALEIDDYLEIHNEAVNLIPQPHRTIFLKGLDALDKIEEPNLTPGQSLSPELALSSQELVEKKFPSFKATFIVYDALWDALVDMELERGIR